MTDRAPYQGLRLAGLGFEFAASVVGLTLLGYWIDGHYDSSPWGLLVGLGIGLIGGGYNMIRAALSAGRPSGPASSEDGAGQDDEG